MKRWIVSVWVIYCSTKLWALPVGNISEPALFTNGLVFRPGTFFNPCNPCFFWIDDWSVRIGFYGDYVFDRDLEVVDVSNNDKLDKTRMSTNGGYFAMNLSQYATIFGMVGGTHFDFLFNKDFILGIIPFEFTTKTGLSGSVGGHVMWASACGLAIGVQAQYFITRQKLDYIISYNSGVVEHFDNGNNDFVCYQEWQVAGGASYRFCSNHPRLAFVPYLAATFSEAKFNMRHTLIPNTPLEIPNFQFKKKWGVAVGGSLTICDAAGVTVEGRLGPEKAIYVNGQFRF